MINPTFTLYTKNQLFRCSITGDLNEKYWVNIGGAPNDVLFELCGFNVYEFLDSNDIKYGEGTWPITSFSDCIRLIRHIYESMPWTPRFKIGDKVRIKPIEGGANDYLLGYPDAMSSKKGTIVTIQNFKRINEFNSIPYFGYDATKYIIEEDSFNWIAEEFEPIALSEPVSSKSIDNLRDLFHITINPLKFNFNL